MNLYYLTLSIKRRKMLLNFLLKFLSPTNKLTVLLSQNLDKHITKYQRHLVKVTPYRKKDNILRKLAA